jgi:hypothetical protein
MDEKDKLQGIENYLKELFPGCVVENMLDTESRKYMFRVQRSMIHVFKKLNGMITLES